MEDTLSGCLPPPSLACCLDVGVYERALEAVRKGGGDERASLQMGSMLALYPTGGLEGSVGVRVKGKPKP
jgi:hypothetical protein